MPLYKGACHCGAIQFEINADIAEVNSCDCSLCRMKNALMCKVHESALVIRQGQDALSLYQWNTRIAQHYFCSICGIYPFHQKRAAPDHYSVNVFCLEGFDPSSVPYRATPGLDMTLVAATARPEWPGPRA